MSGSRRVKTLKRGIGKVKRRSFRLAAESPRRTAVIRLAALRSPERVKEGIEQIKSARLEGDGGFVIDSLE